jgi:hypothetical protein
VGEAVLGGAVIAADGEQLGVERLGAARAERAIGSGSERRGRVGSERTIGGGSKRATGGGSERPGALRSGGPSRVGMDGLDPVWLGRGWCGVPADRLFEVELPGHRVPQDVGQTQ